MEYKYEHKLKFKEEERVETLEKVIKLIMDIDGESRLHVFNHTPYAVWYTNETEKGEKFSQIVKGLSEIDGIEYEGETKRYRVPEKFNGFASVLAVAALSAGILYYSPVRISLKKGDVNVEKQQKSPLEIFAREVYRLGDNYGTSE